MKETHDAIDVTVPHRWKVCIHWSVRMCECIRISRRLTTFNQQHTLVHPGQLIVAATSI